MFTLTRNHIVAGIKDDDLSRYAGKSVRTLLPTEYPHGKKLFSGQRLSSREMQERTHAVLEALNQHEIASGVRSFDWQDALKVAQRSLPVTAPIISKRVVIEADPHDFYDGLRKNKNGRLAPRNYHDPNTGHSHHGILIGYPGVPKEPMMQEVFKHTAAVILTLPDDINARLLWARMTGWPRKYVRRYPADSKLATRFLLLHEMNHIGQLSPVRPTLQTDLFEEVHADYSAMTSLRHHRLGSDVIQAMMKVRFLNILNADPTHWIAPALRALENGKNPQSAERVYKAGMEIRLRIFAALNNRTLPDQGQKDLQSLIPTYDESIGLRTAPSILRLMADSKAFFQTTYRENPAPVFVSLVGLVKQEVFSDRLARAMAKDILQAAEYFSPNISQPKTARPIWQRIPIIKSIFTP